MGHLIPIGVIPLVIIYCTFLPVLYPKLFGWLVVSKGSVQAGKDWIYVTSYHFIYFSVLIFFNRTRLDRSYMGTPLGKGVNKFHCRIFPMDLFGSLVRGRDCKVSKWY
ncbi:hypothetical protein J2S56_002214 [Corynebacterium lowii]|nr:hypothetical protein [Corynebacterium lowii]MDP9852724.1 hypothetical protein [Corynebacterium lowii]